MPTIIGDDQLNDHIIGSDGDDTISGLGGNDLLEGLAGNDTIDGGSGDDILKGGSGTDILTGGIGVDRFMDSSAGLDGDRITDLLPGDRIQITDLAIQSAGIGVVGSTITFTGGSVTVDNLGPGRLIIREIQGGGVEIRLQSSAKNDFNGDGRSDILWQHDGGAVTNWLGQANGGMAGNFANLAATASAGWHIAGTGDFNGDGRNDILWRHDGGTVTNWLGQANGGMAGNFANLAATASAGWHIAGTGDFNGDGRDDILWRHDNGTVTNWLGQANGGMAGNFANLAATASAGWQIAGTGDFNGDGRDDILWRHDNGTVTNWLGQANGGMAGNFANLGVGSDPSWHIAGTGDFNGDGRDDILWRHDNGTVTNWLGQANGGMAGNFANLAATASAGWQIAGTGDYNGDGLDDILWRHDNGTVTNWLGQANGGMAGNFGNLAASSAASWHIVTDDLLF